MQKRPLLVEDAISQVEYDASWRDPSLIFPPIIERNYLKAQSNLTNATESKKL